MTDEPMTASAGGHPMRRLEHVPEDWQRALAVVPGIGSSSEDPKGAMQR